MVRSEFARTQQVLSDHVVSTVVSTAEDAKTVKRFQKDPSTHMSRKASASTHGPAQQLNPFSGVVIPKKALSGACVPPGGNEADAERKHDVAAPWQGFVLPPA